MPYSFTDQTLFSAATTKVKYFLCIAFWNFFHQIKQSNNDIRYKKERNPDAMHRGIL